MTSLAGEFCTTLLGDASNTLIDRSAYVCDKIEIDDGNDDTDNTSFGPAGVATAESHIQGAVTGGVKMSFLFDPTIAKHLRQIVGSRTGFPLRIYSGTNALVTFGDEVYNAVMTLLDMQVNYVPGQTSKIVCNFQIADGTTVVPSFGVY